MNWQKFSEHDIYVLYWVFLYFYCISRLVYDLGQTLIQTVIRIIISEMRQRAKREREKCRIK